MNVTLRIPDELAAHFASADEMQRRAIEALALDEFRLGHLTRPALKSLLGFARRARRVSGRPRRRGKLHRERPRPGSGRPATTRPLRPHEARRRRYGPRYYLVLTGDIELLPRLFAKVLAPERVRDELAHEQAPAAVRAWIAQPPPWLEIRSVEAGRKADDLETLDAGERDALALAMAARADLLLMDDRDGVAAARQRGFAVTGTLGLLDLAARKGLVDLAAAFERLKGTRFYYRQGFLDALLAQHAGRSS